MQSRKPLPLHLNFSWTFAGNAIYAACQWGMLVVLARLGNPEMVGQFTLGLAVTAPVILLTNLQLRNIQATDARQQYHFGDYLGLRLITSGLALLLIGLIVTIAHYPWETSLVIGVMGLARVFESLSDVLYGLIQQHEQMDRIAVSLMLRGPLSLLLLGIGVYGTGSVVWGVAGIAIAWAAVLAAYDWRNGALIVHPSPSQAHGGTADSLRPRWQLKTLRQLVWLALPLGIVMMLISLNTNIPRYLIERYLGERILGIFAAIAYLTIAGNMVIDALGQSASPRLAKYYASGHYAAFRGLLLKLVGIAICLGGSGLLIVSVAGQEILTFLYGPEYGEYAQLLVGLMVAATIGYAASFLGYGMTAARYFRPQIPLFISVTTTVTVACFWLLPRLQLQGMVIALILAAVVQLCISSGIIVYALHQQDSQSS